MLQNLCDLLLSGQSDNMKLANTILLGELLSDDEVLEVYLLAQQKFVSGIVAPTVVTTFHQDITQKHNFHGFQRKGRIGQHSIWDFLSINSEEKIICNMYCSSECEDTESYFWTYLLLVTKVADCVSNMPGSTIARFDSRMDRITEKPVGHNMEHFIALSKCVIGDFFYKLACATLTARYTAIV